jgi:hypothetical protein
VQPQLDSQGAVVAAKSQIGGSVDSMASRSNLSASDAQTLKQWAAQP